METLVLEQYLRVLYTEVRTWVKEQNPPLLQKLFCLLRHTSLHGQALETTRGTSEGIEVGSNSYTTSQTKMLKPTHKKACNTKAPPVMQRSGKAYGMCFNCGKHGHNSNQVHVVSYSSPGLACDTVYHSFNTERKKIKTAPF